MAFSPTSFETDLSDTPASVASCGTGKKVVIASGCLKIPNPDVISHTASITKVKAAATVWGPVTVTIDAGAYYTLPGELVLDADDETIDIVLAEAVDTTAPTCDVAAITN